MSAFASRLAVFALGSLLLPCVSAQETSATEPVKSISIPAQPLSQALLELSKQTDLTLTVPAEILQGKTAPAIHGDFTPSAALSMLLAGSGLQAFRTASGAITIGRLTTQVLSPEAKLRLAQAEGAQIDAGQDPQAPGSQRLVLEEIIVTAARREESLRNVPQSVTALTEQALERIQANDLQDYVKLVPGLQVSTPVPGASQIVLRGLSSLTGASTTGLYVDNTPYGSSSGLANGRFLTGDFNAFDLQRIEVLRGPQGTLYGASTMGGLLKFVTNPPDTTQFAGLAQLNSEDIKGDMGWSARGMINVPLSERAALRLTAVRKEDPGFIDDPARDHEGINDTVSTGMRASLLFRVNDALSVRLTSVGQENELDGANDVDLAVDTADPALTPLQPYRPLFGDLQQSRTFPETTDVRYRVHNLTVSWDLQWANLMSATSYGTHEQDALLDSTLLDGLIQRQDSDLSKVTQEIQLTSRPGSRYEWVAGVYYTRENGSIANRYTNYIYDGSSIEVDSKFEEVATFATFTVPFTPQFDVALGARVARNEQHEFQHGTGVFVGFVSTEDSAENVVLYSIAPRWKPTDATTVYARIASGYRPGGPNVIPLGNPPGAPRTFDADTVLSFESGIKTDLLERRLSLDLSAFFLRWKDLQLSGFVNETSVISNAGEAESKGFEWSAALRPGKGLTIDLVGAYTDAALTEPTSSGTEVDLLGGKVDDPLPYVSKWTTLVGLSYEWTLAADATAYIGGNWSYVGERRTDFGSVFGRQLTLPSYDITDVRAGLDFHRWSVEIYGKNITDERGVASLSVNASPGGGGIFNENGVALGSTFLVIRPRTVGLMVSARF